ncbi:MAG: hypothetical protein H6R09_1582 [Proteobacteria bacterium]|nr:hypothetical protein [Pseudomonadota bacterium]
MQDTSPQCGDGAVIVGGDHQRGPHLMEVAEHGHDVCGVAGVEVAGGFVGQQQGRAADQRAGNAQALLLASRQADRIGFFTMQQPDLVDHGTRAFQRIAALEAGDIERQHHIFDHVAVEQQLVVLEHQADVATQIRHGKMREAADILTVDRHHTAGGAFDGGDELEQGALSGTGMPGEEHQFAFFDRQVDRRQGLVTAGITLGDLAETDHAVNTASTNSRASNGRRSSTVSPTPI